MTLGEALLVFGLRPFTSRVARVAIVDSGIYANHPHVQGAAGGVSLIAGADAADYIDRHGHGTAVAAAIREKAPAAELVAVKIFDRTLAATADDLARGIEWAAGQHVDLINLSLGTANPAHVHRLQAALTHARAAGAVVVTAAEVAGLAALPGSLRGVIAVSVDWEIERDQVIVEGAGDETIRLRASGYPRPIPGVSSDRNVKGISFAVANATGVIARYLGASKIP